MRPKLDALGHRGPDEQGMRFPSADVALAPQIIDLRADAGQPMPSEGRSVWAVCNDEIYLERAALATEGGAEIAGLLARETGGDAEMSTRRTFLKQATFMTLAGPTGARLVGALGRGRRLADSPPPSVAAEPLGWKPHPIARRRGRQGWVVRPGWYRILHKSGGRYVFPYGLVRMDNGEVLLLGSWHNGEVELPVIAFSSDGGWSWGDFETILDIAPVDVTSHRPAGLAYLGGGRLTFQFQAFPTRLFSSDYGRTWTERIPVQPATDGGAWHVEGNPLIDRDVAGRATRLAEVGWYHPTDVWPQDPTAARVRWSSDDGRTWTPEVRPPTWQWEVEDQGQRYVRGVSEGSLVRAANGSVVAALRTDMPPRYFDAPNDDSLEGLGVSISNDDGATWSVVQPLYDAGRHHAHLLRLPDGCLLMTVIARDDVRDVALASYRRGCEAIVSEDNGRTWSTNREYVLDDHEYYDGIKWFDGMCGHLSSTLLDDGAVLTCYANYLTRGVSLIRWRPRH